MATDAFSFIKPAQLLPGFKVVFMSAADPTDSLQACFNPEALDISVSCDIGRLGAVGWSHATQQYARTEPIDFPMHLEFSAIAMRDAYGKVPSGTDTQVPIRWFMKHCYGAAPGLAPDPVIVSWPGTLLLKCVIRSMNVSMKRWDSNGVLTNYAIDLDLTELRDSYRSAGDAAANGFDDPTDRTSGKSGTPLKLGRTARKFHS